MKGKLLLLLLSVFMISTTASAGSETLLTSDRLIFDTEVGNHLVTWYETSGNGLHIYDLNTMKIIDGSTINNYDITGGVDSNVEVYNNYAVWSGMDNNITLYDSSTNTATQIDTNNCYNSFIYGSKIVYNKNDYICIYDINTKSKSQFLSQGMRVSDLYGNKLVGTIYNNSRSDVYIADIGTRQMTAISTSGQARTSEPQIYGNVVVWTESDNTKSNVFMRDINAHVTSQVTTDGRSSDPKIYGNRIVYDSRYTSNGKPVNNVYMYDKSTKKTTQITTSGTARFPSIYGDNIVYVDSKNDDPIMQEGGEIYLYSLIDTPAIVKPVAAFTASKTSGSTHPATITFMGSVAKNLAILQNQ